MREHNTIFSEKEIKAKIKNAFPKGIANKKAKLEIIENWQDNLASGKYVVAKEEEIGSLFLNKFFGEVLDYKYDNPENWNLKLENKTEFDSTKADAALGYFKIKDKKELPKDVRAVIEVKNARTPLDLQQTRIKSLSPVEQGFMYAAKNGEKCKWVIISNFVEIRLYRASDMTKYESFDVMSLHNEYEFLRFYYLLAFGQLFLENSDSTIDILLSERLEREKNIENEFYQEYQYLRELFYYHLKAHNTEIPPLKLLEYAQTIIDRIIFISVIKDYELIPYNVVSEITDIANKSWEKDKQELWRQIKKFFIAIDEGFPSRMHKFNGGLFKNNEQINNLIIKDVFLKRLLVINSYDFKSDLDVNILGHIFEQSITDLEQLKLDILDSQGYEYTETDTEINLKIPTHKESKRKKDGIFYTPEEITNYIVKQTVGKLLQEKKDEIGITKLQELPDNKINIKEQIILWNKYKEILKNIKILDPACGSGAFLSQAYNFLLQEWQTLFDIYEKLEINKIEKNGDGLFNGTNNRQKTISKIKKHIVNNNIFGVDLNFESVEITKLALWIKSANKNDVLATLDQNIKCGNSLISDKKISDKAFVWETEFKEIIDNGGFDIIVGNPPYVYSRDGRIDSEDQKYFREKYNFIQHRINTYFLFVDKSYEILKEKGYLGFIIPNTWQTVNSFSELREFLITKTSELNIINIFDKIFKDANVDTCLLSFKKDKPTKILLGELENKEIKIIGKFDKSIFISPDFYINFKLAKNPIYLKLLNKIQDNSVEIENVADVKTGIIAYLKNNGIPKQTEDDVKNRIYHSYKQEDSDYFKYFQGKDITRYKYHWSGQWIKYGENLGRKRQKELFENERILIKQIPSPLPYCLNAVYVNEHIINDINSTIITNFRKPPLFLLSVINSRLTSFWFVVYFDKLQRKLFPQFKIQDLKKFPVPKASKQDEKELIELSSLMLSLNKDLIDKSEKFIKRIKANLKVEEVTSKLHNFYDYNFITFVNEVNKMKVKLSLKQQDEWEEYFDFHKNEITNLENIIKQTDKKIDEKIYKLYKLTDAEIKIIENLK